MPHILVVDDERDLCEILVYNLNAAEYHTDVAHSAEDAMKLQLTDYDPWPAIKGVVSV